MKNARLPTLSAKERIVLDLLVSSGAKYGLQLVDESRGTAEARHRLRHARAHGTEGAGRVAPRTRDARRRCADAADVSRHRPRPAGPRRLDDGRAHAGAGAGTMTNTERGPGSRLRRFAERTFERQTLERVILPAIADVEFECADDAGTLAPGAAARLLGTVEGDRALPAERVGDVTVVRWSGVWRGACWSSFRSSWVWSWCRD